MRGVIPRMIDGLFDEKVPPQQYVSCQWVGSCYRIVVNDLGKDRLEKEPLQELQVRISYLEIYKECSKELHRKTP